MKFKAPEESEYDVFTHARNYVKECPAAVSGDGGHNITFRVACVLVNGFDLQPDQARSILNEYNERCSPPWSERELEHKLAQASSIAHSEPRGHMRKRGVTYGNTPPSNPYTHDKFIQFLNAAFEPNDVLSIVDCIKNEEGRCIPEHGGVNVFTRDEWIERYKQKDMDISKLGFPSPHGAYVRINPVLKDSKGSDKDVTAYRHVLVESDTLPKHEQQRILTESGLPISVMIDSGGKSIHAWVRVDALNKEEYDERRKKIWDTLPELDLDEANKNPSRFSRLPCVFREEKEQRLIATKIGCKDFDEWEHKQLGFPAIVNLTDFLDTEMPPCDPVVEGIFERGDFLNFSGGSKTRKTWTMMHLGLCVAQGSRWFGKDCKQGNVLYMNMELKKEQSHKRMNLIINNGLGGRDKWTSNFSMWNLKGHAASIEKMRPALEKELDRKDYSLLIIDPIYMLYGGRNENDNGEMIDFLNLLSSITVTRDTAVAFASHHNKQGKNSDPVNSSAGAGVFGRQPDAIIAVGPDKDNKIMVDYVLRNFEPVPRHEIQWDEQKCIHEIYVQPRFNLKR